MHVSSSGGRYITGRDVKRINTKMVHVGYVIASGVKRINYEGGACWVRHSKRREEDQL